MSVWRKSDFEFFVSWRKRRRRVVCIIETIIANGRPRVIVNRRVVFDWRVSLSARSGISLVLAGSICDDGVIGVCRR